MHFFRRILFAFVAIAGLAAAGPVLFSVTPIQLPSGYSVDAFPGINNLGQVAGGVLGPGNTQSLFISNGSSFTLVSIPSGWSPQQVYINNAGQIAGWADVPATPTSVAFFGTAAGVSAIPTPPETLQPGQVPGTSITGLNNSGEVVGSTATSQGLEAFVGTSAGITLLPYTIGAGINDQGQLLVEGGSVPQSFILTGSNAVPIPGPVGGTGLNNADQVVSAFPQSSVSTIGGVTVIPFPSGTDESLFAFINNAGVVAGTDVSQENPAVRASWIWDPVNGLQLISAPAGWTIESVEGINDLGQILAVASFSDSSTSSLGAQASFTGDVILTQATPEPTTSSMVLLGISVAIVARVVRKSQVRADLLRNRESRARASFS